MDLGLKDEMLTKETVKGLNQYLANLHVLFTKLHNYHWNVVGSDFFTFHEKLQELYEFIGEEIDRVGERILMLGYKPIANLESALDKATIKEAPSVDFSAPKIARSVINDFLMVVKQIRDTAEIAGENNDEATSGLLGNAIAFFEKMIWMFRAYLTN